MESFDQDYYRMATSVPDDARLLVYGKGHVRHVQKTGALLRRVETWCAMFWWPENLREATEDDWDKPLCGACLRTLPAQVAAIDDDRLPVPGE
jgi:hypothetical protein